VLSDKFQIRAIIVTLNSVKIFRENLPKSAQYFYHAKKYTLHNAGTRRRRLFGVERRATDGARGHATAVTSTNRHGQSARGCDTRAYPSAISVAG
jgi:hypothetical protein